MSWESRRPPLGLRVPWRALAAWLLVVAAVTLGLRMLHPPLDKAHMVLAFLLVVLAGSARQGRVLGLVLAITSFLAFNFFLIPPFHTFRVADPLDWGVLGTFLITGSVAAELFHRQQRATRMAERRAREIDRLAGLIAESLSVARAEEAVVAIARVIRFELPVRAAEILLRSDVPWTGTIDRRLVLGARLAATDPIMVALRERSTVGVRHDGTVIRAPQGSPLAAMLREVGRVVEVIVPLRVRDRMLGVLRLSNPEGLAFMEAEIGFADALAYYGALAVERVRLEAEADHVEALREADRLKDAVLASLSHDLRTPLTSIQAAAGELRAEGEERGAIIEEESERLNRLVTDLLDLSRIRAGSVPTELEVNAAEDLIGAALHRVAGIPGAADVRVTLPEGELAIGRFDFLHSLRALTNLLENALRYSPAQGSVGIEVEQGADRLCIRVVDRGPGVPPEDRDRLFEPFFRSASAGGTHGGAGLGLAIADSLARAQGGSVTYRDRPGGGSIFELALQAAAPEALL